MKKYTNKQIENLAEIIANKMPKRQQELLIKKIRFYQMINVLTKNNKKWEK